MEEGRDGRCTPAPPSLCLRVLSIVTSKAILVGNRLLHSFKQMTGSDIHN